jgi:hypothetical protein
MEVACVGEISQHVFDSTTCWDMVFFNREEALYCTPLSSYPPIVLEKSGCSRSEYSVWILQRVKEIHRVLGVSCVGYEE